MPPALYFVTSDHKSYNISVMMKKMLIIWKMITLSSQAMRIIKEMGDS